MFRRVCNSLPVILVLSLVGLVTFAATAFAAGAVAPADADALDLLTPVWQAFAHGSYLYAGCLTVVLAVGVCKRYGWVHSEKGMVGLTFAGAMAASLASSAAAGTISPSTAWSAFKIAAGAAGGYAVLKSLLVDPYLRPLQAKLPAWARMPLSLVLWVFSKRVENTAANETKKAEAAGEAAVAEKPAAGVSAVLGEPVEIQ